jgi:cobalt/nickel transport system permease protein
MPAAGHTHLGNEALRATGPVGRLDPRVRVAGAAGLCLLAACLERRAALWGLTAAGGALCLGAGLGPRVLWRRFRGVLALLALYAALLPLTARSGPYVLAGPLALSRPGLLLAEEVAARSLALLLALVALVGSLEPAVLAHALHRLRLPRRLVVLLFFAVRYLGVLRAEHRRLQRALRVRGFRSRPNLLSLRALGYSAGMLLVRSLERSERIEAAMKCRGFRGRFPVLDEFRTGRADALFLLAGAAGALLLLALELA